MRITMVSILLAAALLTPSSAGAASPKSAGKAMVLSGLVLPGSGQMYCGETGRGVAILAGELLLFSQVRNPSSDYDNASLAAALALVTLHILQTGDAGRAAERANARAGLAGTRAYLLESARSTEPPSLSLDLDVVKRSAMVKKTWRF